MDKKQKIKKSQITKCKQKSVNKNVKEEMK